MIILAIESTTNICSIAVLKDGKLTGYMEADIPQRQLTWITPSIDKLLKRKKINFSDISYVAVTNGPGSYTGLRLGIITAKTIAQFLNIPIIAYNTLEVLAFNCIDSDNIIIPLLDAKKNEIYASAFIRDGEYLKQIGNYAAYNLDELICYINAINKTVTNKPVAAGFSLRKKEILFTGTALHRYKEELNEKIKIKHKFASKELWYPKASALAEMAYRDIENNKAKLLGYADLEAYYLREPDIGKKSNQNRGLASQI